MDSGILMSTLVDRFSIGTVMCLRDAGCLSDFELYRER